MGVVSRSMLEAQLRRLEEAAAADAAAWRRVPRSGTRVMSASPSLHKSQGTPLRTVMSGASGLVSQVQSMQRRAGGDIGSPDTFFDSLFASDAAQGEVCTACYWRFCWMGLTIRSMHCELQVLSALTDV